MSDLFFFVRMMIMTSLFLLVLQIRFGEQTLEQQSMSFIQHSAELIPLHKTAEGGAKVIRDLWSSMTARVRDGVGHIFSSEDRPGERKFVRTLERSKDYLKEKAQATKKYVADQFGEAEKSIEDEASADSERANKLREELREDGVLPSTDKAD